MKIDTLATMQDLVIAYQHLHLPQLKDQAGVKCRIRLYFGPILHLPVESMSVPVVIEWVNGIRKRSVNQANGCLKLLSSMINRAIEWNLWTGPNPALRVRSKPSKRRTRYVMDHEMPLLLREIEREPAMQRLYYYFILFCGGRPGEAEKIEIAHIRNGVWYKPDTKSEKEQRVLMPADMLDLLQRHLRAISPECVYLFENRATKHPYTKVNWNREWSVVRKRAGLEDVRLHDLRRTCSTNLNDGKLDLNSISKGVLNHSNLSTTQVYLVTSAEKVGHALTANMRQAMLRAKDPGTDDPPALATVHVLPRAPQGGYHAETRPTVPSASLSVRTSPDHLARTGQSDSAAGQDDSVSV